MLKPAFMQVSSIYMINRAYLPLFITWLLISLSFSVSLLDSTQPPYINLTGLLSEVVYILAFSGGKFGAPVIAVIMLVLLITRKGVTKKRRWQEAVVLISVSLLLAGGGAAFNEHVVKNEFKVPRPNIIWLAQESTAGGLEMSAEQFYLLGDKTARRQPLFDVLNKKPAPVLLSESVRSHWIEETGYSFPSGHAFSAMFFASLFLLFAVGYLSSKRLWLFYALLPWALAVCYSRTLLRVHTPTDIFVGGLQGLVLGILAWLIASRILRRLDSSF